MVDPEEMAQERRDLIARTAAYLEAQRQGDALALPTQWLARIRGDRRPNSIGVLMQAIADVATEDGVPTAAVRAGLDRALAHEGGLARWEAALRRPRPRADKGPAPQQLRLVAP